MSDQRKRYRVPFGKAGGHTTMLLTEDTQKRSYPNAELLTGQPQDTATNEDSEQPTGTSGGEKADQKPNNKAAPIPENKSADD